MAPVACIAWHHHAEHGDQARRRRHKQEKPECCLLRRVQAECMLHVANEHIEVLNPHHCGSETQKCRRCWCCGWTGATAQRPW
jgi:hypothetical protein